MFVLDRSQRARVQKFPRIVAVVLSAALLASALEARQPAEAAPAADPKPTAAMVSSRPDLISASVTARSQGSRVEVESMRTESSTTWVNPDTTMTTDAHMAPIRFKTAQGAWQSIDLTLAKAADGTVAPRSHQHGLQLGKRNAATGGVFASAAGGAGRQVEWLAPWKLPEPTLQETKATYTEVQPGVDMTLDARRSGFEVDFIVKQRPATAPVWRIPLRTKGLTARQAADGTIEFVDAQNTVRSRIPVGQMWDSVNDEHTGQPVNTATVKVTLEQVSPGKATLVIAPDAEWFLDPARVFPVTVDPTYANTPVYSSFDTFVQSGWTSDLSSTVDLRVGKNGTTTERSFLNFAGAAFQGKDITSASLSLYQYGATTCTATQLNLHAALQASTSTRWTSQPVTSATVWGSVSTAKGFSSACAAGRIAVPMTSLAQYWSGQPDPTVGVALKAANEADANAWKRFVSSEGTADPYISLTWNRPPNPPATVETSEAVAYAAPGENTSSMYSASLKPWVQTKATDPDANTVKYVFEFFTGDGPTFSLKGTCTSSVYASGTTAGCRPSTNLPDNTLLYVRAKANDGRVDGPWTSYQSRLRTGAAKPADPVVNCPAPYDVSGSWLDNPPAADVVCTVTATGTSYSAPGYLRLTVDGKPVASNTGVAGQYKITPSSDPAVAKTTVTLPKGSGLHAITAQAESPAGNLSDVKTHNVGWGGTALTSPTANPRITTANTLRITASGPPKGSSSTVSAKIRWRVSGYGGADDLVGWNEDTTAFPVTDSGTGGVSVNTNWDTNNAKIDTFLDSDPDIAGVQPTTLNDRVPVKLDIQVCFKYGTTDQCTWSQTPDTTIQRVPHAFGNGFPTAEAGPGQVALWTGEFNASATDISVPGYTADLSISRSHMTYETPTNQINGAFGQGWTAQFDGADVGAAGLQVIDSTRIDGTLVLIDGDGTSLIFESPTSDRRTGASFALGEWAPADEDTELDGSRLTITGTATSPLLSYIEDDGTVTTWTPATTPTTSAAALFRAVGIAEPGIASKTTFAYDANGRIVRILAPVAPGVTCAAYNASAPLTGMNPGCRALRFTYTTIGASRVRLSEAWIDIYNPDKTGTNKMDSIQVAAYTYDTNALLTKVTDPRSNLSTEYTYNAENHLSSVKPAGQVPFQLNYVTVDQRDKLDSVTRDRPAGDPTGGTATLAKFVYDVPLSGTGLPDLTAGAVAQWNQKATPTNGFAVFGPDHPVTGAPTADDWQYADLQYTDAAGYTINTAKYGAGNWQYTSTDYNDQGNVVRELDERALRAVIDDPARRGAAADQLASLTAYNADIKNAAGDAVLTPAGTLVTDTYGPARYAALKNGTVTWVRPHTHTTFDQGAPNAGINPDTSLPYRLATTETSYAHDPGTGTDLEITGQSLTDYSAPVAGDADGWARSLPGKAITDVDRDGTNSPGDIVKVTRYDAEGGVIETRQPTANGSDAGTAKTVYYTTAANSTVPECGSKPQWAGLVCRTYPATAPTSTAGATPTLPSTTTAAFTYLLAPKTVTETSGSVTRTTITDYLLDGRTGSTKTTVTGITGSSPNTEKITSYDPNTGQQTVVTAKNTNGTTVGTITTGYDTWGRQITYQPSAESATTTVYDAAGSVATVTDANGSTIYTYDGTDAAGKAERRGLATKVEVTTGGSTWTSTGAYDADGSMTVQKLPGGVTQHNDIDNTGEPVGLRYTGQVTTVNEDGSTTVDPNGGWLSWSLENDVTGRVSHEWTPDGTAFTTTGGGAIPYDRHYTYDNAGRLTQVNDRTAGASGIDVTDPAEAPACVTRTYGFDANDNRLTKATAPAAADGSCSTSGATTVTRAFDTADRPVTGANGVGGYAYDVLGRTTSLPASDAPHPADGDITFVYYDNDLASSITQGATTTSFTLDALDRRAAEIVTNASGSTQTVRHYNDTSDNPTWVTQGAATQRYAELIGSDLALTVDQVGTAELTLNNSHGDVVTTVDLPTGGGVATGIGGWNNYDEYGNAVGVTADTGIVDYGWLGGKQRAVSGAGLTLMGVRLYNPITALFTSTDPVAGGNANAYTYPSDPINSFDTDGKRRYYEEDETPKRLRFKKWYNGFSSALTRKIYYPNYPYKDAPRKYAPTKKKKTTKWWPRKKHWKKFGRWSMRRVKGAFFYGMRGAGAGGFLGAVGGGFFGGGPGALAGGGYGLWYGSWGGIGYGLMRGHKTWW
ncbi:RHS repeat-associated core domain-containing protein [Kribbella catacumbae]|uniref:RHS repeat-associated core domain-containing protein n=1 Tax=Kribbella catacumbae TaxID=460086 RepID=UPI00035F9BE0|nr:RHS repeat-associated core domain-containing protein [Kribbella catacumbae]